MPFTLDEITFICYPAYLLVLVGTLGLVLGMQAPAPELLPRSWYYIIKENSGNHGETRKKHTLSSYRTQNLARG